MTTTIAKRVHHKAKPEGVLCKGSQVTISAPHMHAMTLELLEPFLQPGSTALDVGSGTGYLTACPRRGWGPEVGRRSSCVPFETMPRLCVPLSGCAQ